MKADRLHKFSSLALPKFKKYKNKLTKTCFEHDVLLIRRSKLYFRASGIFTPFRWQSGAKSSLNCFWLAVCIVVVVLCLLLLVVLCVLL